MSNSSVRPASKAEKLSKQQLALLKSFEKTSTQVRYLNSLGLTRPEIRRALIKHLQKTKRPQHIRGILVTPVTNPTETWEE